MKILLEKNDTASLLRPPRIGDIVEGTIINSGRSMLYVDLGAIGTGVVLGREFYNARGIIKKMKPGDKLAAKVLDIENEDGYIELSLRAADKEIAWKKLKELKDSREPIKVKIVGANKGGLLAEVSGIAAFLPASQLSAEHYPRVENADQQKILKELQQFIGQEFEVNVLDLDAAGEKLILSEKIKEIEKIKQLLTHYKPGDIVDAEVTGVVGFGAFVRFKAAPSPTQPVPEAPEYIEGLIHIAELDWQLIENTEDIVKVGDIVKAKIIKIEDDRVFLSLKALKQDPWENIEKERKKGDMIRGVVTKITTFGAFVEVIPGVQGLCHISEFGTKEKMDEALRVGQEHDFLIFQLDPKEHKMTLRFGREPSPPQLNNIDELLSSY